MKLNFESPFHTARDLVERDMTLYMYPGSEIWKQWLSQSEIPEYRKIAESMIIALSTDQFDALTKNEFINHGTLAQMISYLEPFELEWTEEKDNLGKYKYNHGRGYYRGEKVSGLIPMTGYLSNKKWHLNEVEN